MHAANISSSETLTSRVFGLRFCDIMSVLMLRGNFNVLSDNELRYGLLEALDSTYTFSLGMGG